MPNLLAVNDPRSSLAWRRYHSSATESRWGGTRQVHAIQSKGDAAIRCHPSGGYLGAIWTVPHRVRQLFQALRSKALRWQTYWQAYVWDPARVWLPPTCWEADAPKFLARLAGPAAARTAVASSRLWACVQLRGLPRVWGLRPAVGIEALGPDQDEADALRLKR